MAKKFDFFSILMWIVALIVSLGIGGLFIAGGFLNVIILNWLPLIIHQGVGWLIIGSTALSFLVKLFK